MAGALAGVALALQGCAPAGYNQDGDQVSVANEAAAAAETTPTPDASEGAEETADEPKKDVPITTKLTAKNLPRMGQAVVDQEGWILYRFDKDTANPPTSNCVDKCEQVWPPAYTENGKPDLSGVDESKVGVITREDGTKQLTLDGWALYRYIGDKKPGQWKGQGVGGTWFVIAADGKRNVSCLPTFTPKPVEPPAEDAADKGDGGDSETYNY
ncbi:COG4315 family predicted lipoprotein [Phytohabitans kaempferiae]|uniref:Lipoprotein n=1 Tax=Phytohabitans kaempferiae TaxID=1620943 RepID=A0ABV6M9D0_9ACTN